MEQTNQEPTSQPEQSSTPAPVVNTPVASTDSVLVFNILSYLGPLVLVTLVAAKDQPATKFHLRQGLVLFGVELVVYATGSFFIMLTMGLIAPVLMLLNVGCLVLTLIGIYHAMQKQEKPLPLIGFLADKLPL